MNFFKFFIFIFLIFNIEPSISSVFEETNAIYGSEEYFYRLHDVKFVEEHGFFVFGRATNRKTKNSENMFVFLFDSSGNLIKRSIYKDKGKPSLFFSDQKNNAYVLSKKKDGYFLYKIDQGLNLLPLGHLMSRKYKIHELFLDKDNIFSICGSRNNKQSIYARVKITEEKIYEMEMQEGSNNEYCISSPFDEKTAVLLIGEGGSLSKSKEERVLKKYEKLTKKSETIADKIYDKDIFIDNKGKVFFVYDKRFGIKQEVRLLSLDHKFNPLWNKHIVTNNFGLTGYRIGKISKNILVVGNKKNRVFWSLIDADTGKLIVSEHKKETNPVMHPKVDCSPIVCLVSGTEISLGKNKEKNEKLLVSRLKFKE